ncbi:MAG: ndh [Ignavibacteria bacterium]|nr:ndh [Ignavibacteria bacterium]
MVQLSKPRVIIVGGGFGGLACAKTLKNARFDVVLIDRTNHHVFQPLLYQVAVSALSPGDIGIPLRSILRNYHNTQVIMDEVQSVELSEHKLLLADGDLNYDYLVLAPGARHSYFGNPQWEELAPGLKSLRDAIHIRERMLLSFETAERYYHTSDSKKYLTFVIVGGGPTGVELAGAIAEIGRKTLLPDYPILSADDIRVILIEAHERLLSSYSQKQSEYTLETLEKIGVEIILNTRVKTVLENKVITNNDEEIETVNVIWAAGNKASPLIRTLGIEVNHSGCALVQPDLSVPGYPNVFVIGDAAHLIDVNGVEAPAVAPTAIQQGIYVAKLIKSRKIPSQRKSFAYKDKGNMATIGRLKAVAMFGKLRFTGFTAWFMWCFIHILFLINFRNRLRVMVEWFWFYITRQPGARLIVQKEMKMKEKEE